MRAPSRLGILLLCGCLEISVSTANGQEGIATAPPAVMPRVLLVPARPDPIRAAQILELAETTFPNLARDLDAADLLRRVIGDPSIRGNLRGRLAEAVFEKNFAPEGWRRVASGNARENDFFRRRDGKLEGAQIKVHANPNDYFHSMRRDRLAEQFVVPDDHFVYLKGEYKVRRESALRGGLLEKAQDYADQDARLKKLGRTFAELDNGLAVTAQRYAAISAVIRQSGRAASFFTVALSVVDGSIAIYNYAAGKDDVLQFIRKVGKAGVAGVSAWYVSVAVSQAAAGAGATGLVPVAVAIVTAYGTYLVVDWAVDKVVDSLSTAQLTQDDLKNFSSLGMPPIPQAQSLRGL